MTRRPLSRVLTALALAAVLAAPLGGCVAYPAYPGYGYGGYAYAPGYAYPCCVAVGGYWGGGGGWYGGGWHGGGGDWHGGGGGWHH